MTDPNAHYWRALGERAVQSPAWRWLPGMLDLNEDRVDSAVTDPATLAPPDFRDPATAGCLLHLVREYVESTGRQWCLYQLITGGLVEAFSPDEPFQLQPPPPEDWVPELQVNLLVCLLPPAGTDITGDSPAPWPRRFCRECGAKAKVLLWEGFGERAGWYCEMHGNAGFKCSKAE